MTTHALAVRKDAKKESKSYVGKYLCAWWNVRMEDKFSEN